MEKWLSVLGRPLLGNSIYLWISALLATLLLYYLLMFLRKLAQRVLRRTEDSSKGGVIRENALRLVELTNTAVLLVCSVSLAVTLLRLSPDLAVVMRKVLFVALFFQAGLWVSTLMKAVVTRHARERSLTDPSSLTAIGLISFGVDALVWVATLLLMLENLGIDITALIAGLGIGGVAVALAAQNILGDLFASLSIVMDKPFVVGDFIVVGDIAGTVEQIGVKTTRIRSLSGEQLIVSNTDLLQSRIKNFKRMRERRVLFTVGVTYQTPIEKVRAIPSIVRAEIEKETETRFDRGNFQSFGDSALLFEFVYFVKTDNYNVYADIHERICLGIMSRFEDEAIEFAYPTQTLFLDRVRSSAQESAEGGAIRRRR